VECFQLVLPLVVLLFCLQSWLFVLSGRNIAKYILQTCCILVDKKTFVLLSQTHYTFNIQLTICCCVLLFVQLHNQWHFINFIFTLRGQSRVIALSNKELEVTICEVLFFASNYCSCIIISYQYVVSFSILACDLCKFILMD